MARNASLHAAKEAKNDEFYTRREDIENELSHYSEHFRDKVVYCNCDDPETSEFWQFFRRNFRPWGLKKLMATHYEPDEKNYAYMLEISDDTNGDGVVDWKDEPTITQIPCNGDFRSAYCIELLKEADIVVTNPPFSLFRQYVAQLMEYKKKFLIIGSMNAITYKEIFPLLKDNMIWLGYNHPKEFRTPNGGTQKFGNIMWFTNLDIPKRHTPLDLRGNYYYGHEDEYPKYDNYDAIECSKVSDIPSDYEPCWYKCEHAAECEYAQKEGISGAVALCEEECNGAIGVPITYIDKHNNEQFEIVDADFNLAESMDKIDPYGTYEKGGPAFYINNSKKSVDNDAVNEGQSSGARGQGPGARGQGPQLSPPLQTDCHSQEESVTASSVSQSRSSTNCVQNNLECLLAMSQQLASQLSESLGKQNINLDKSWLVGKHVKRPIIDYSYKKRNGVIGVPITFLDKHCTEQFEIVSIACGNSWANYTNTLKSLNFNPDIKYGGGLGSGVINGKGCYARMLIRRKTEM